MREEEKKEGGLLLPENTPAVEAVMETVTTADKLRVATLEALERSRLPKNTRRQKQPGKRWGGR